MSENTKELTKADLERLFSKLDAELSRRGQKATLYVVGGANISLALDASRTTTDLDAVIKSGFDIIFDAAKAVAEAEGDLGQDWLNADFTGGTPEGGIAWSFMDHRDDDEPATTFAGKSLTVELASPKMMLALKTLANRQKDLGDIYLLMRKTGIKTPLELGKNLAYFTGRRIFDEQGRPGMPHHIDTKFPYIFDNAPDDLRPPKTEKQTLLQRLGFRSAAVKAQCPHGRRHLKNGAAVREEQCAKHEGHRGLHRYRGLKP